MKSQALFILILQILSIYATISQHDESFFSELKKSDFGQTLLRSLQVELKFSSKESSIKKIVSLLNTMSSQIEAEQKTDDENYSQLSQTCDTSLSSLANDIIEAQNSIKNSQIELNTVEKLLETKQESLKTAQNDVSFKENQLNDLENIRKNELMEFVRSTNEINNDIDALYDGKSILNNLKKEESFLQTKGKEYTEDFEESMKKISGGFSGVFKHFAVILRENYVQADQNMVKKILGLFDELIEKLNDDLRNEREAETERISIYNSEKTLLLSQLTQLNGEVSELLSAINNNQNKINELKRNIENNQQIENDKTKQRQDQEKSCNDGKESYTQRTDNRNNELNIIKEVINIFQTRFENVSNYVKQISFKNK